MATWRSLYAEMRVDFISSHGKHQYVYYVLITMDYVHQIIKFMDFVSM